jgi:AcrR family transcriptional regulator
MPTQRTNEAVKAQVLIAARILMDEQGPSAVTISALVARTGLSRVTIFRLWPDHDSLIAEAIGMGSF